MPVTLSNALLPLTDLSPLIRNNNNASDALSVKAGPHGITRSFTGTSYRMWVEAVSDTNNGGFDNTTGFMYATAPSLQGPWTTAPATRIFDPTNGSTWENFEASPSSVFWDKVNKRWTVWYHGGNNSVARQVGVAYSLDGDSGQTFIRDGGNPIIAKGTVGATDANGVADFKAQRTISGSFVGFYTGLEAGGAPDGTIHRATATTVNSWTKQGRVINAVPATWNANGMHPGLFWIDPEGRLHMFVGAPTTVNGAIGYYYSDDLGATFTAYGSNPVASGLGDNSNFNSTGDVVQGYVDGDVLFITSGTDALTFATNPPMRGQHAYITPARVTNPVKKAKFYMPSAYTSVTGTSPLSNTVFSIMGRFKAYRLKRVGFEPRHFWAEQAAFNITSFVRIQGNTSTANDGKLHAWFRTPTGLTADMYSISTVDDGTYHSFLVRRTATNAFELWLDGVLQVTDSTTVGTDATVTTKAVGNWDPATGNPDGPSKCTVSDLVVIIGTAVTWAQATSVLSNRTFPAGVSATIDFPTNGTDTGDVALVDGFGFVADNQPMGKCVYVLP